MNEIQAPGELISVKMRNLLLVAMFPVVDNLHLVVFVCAQYSSNVSLYMTHSYL